MGRLDDLPRDLVILGDCLQVLRGLPSNTVDAAVTDPPAGIEFMGAEWDTFRQGRMAGYQGPPQGSMVGVERTPGSFGARMAANPAVSQRANRRCRTCGHYAYSGTPCQCNEPDWMPDTSVRDTFVAFMEAVAIELYRVLKPGAHGVVWALPRTSHWTATALENAGFEIRDRIAHLFGQGFPKSLNVAKALDRAGGAMPEEQADLLQARRLAMGWSREELAEKVGCTEASIRDWEEGRARKKGAEVEYVIPSAKYRKKLAELLEYSEDERQMIGLTKPRKGDGTVGALGHSGQLTDDKAKTEMAKKWQGWGTALKPGAEDWWLIRKPLQGSVADNVTKYGTGAINVDGTRVGVTKRVPGGLSRTAGTSLEGSKDGSLRNEDGSESGHDPNLGRWPSNVLLSHGPGCRKVGEQTVEGPLMNRYEGKLRYYFGGEGQAYTSEKKPDEQVDVYQCEEGCPVRTLNEQSGDRPATLTGHADPTMAHTHPSSAETDSWFNRGLAKGSQVYADEGGASRYFQTFEPAYDAPFFYNGKITTRERNEGFEDDVEAQAQHGIEEQTLSTQSNRRCTLCGRVKFGAPHCECPEPVWEETQGSKSKNFHPCLHPDALVLTERGYRPIRTIERGDYVYAADGRFHPVSYVSSHTYTRPDLFEIKVRGMSETTLATDNHPFLIWRPTRKGAAIVGGEVLWLEAQEIRKGDYTMTPVLRAPEVAPRSSPDAFLFGLYLAEGVIQTSGHGTSMYASFTFHEDETDLIGRLQQRFPGKVSVYPKAGTRAVQVAVFDGDFGRACADLCGRGSSTKRLTSWIWHLGPADQIALWEGWMAGDGGRVRGHLQAKTVSPDLAAQMALLGEVAGYRARVYKSAAPQGEGIGDRLFKTTQPVYQLDFSKSSRPAGPVRVEHEGTTYTLRPVSSVTRVPYEGEVINLSVEGSPTFMTAVGMSHNTVKPTKLMRYLCKLVTPPGGTIIDPFAGSGSTLVAAAQEGFRFVGIERDPRFHRIAVSRSTFARRVAQEEANQREGFELMASLPQEE